MDTSSTAVEAPLLKVSRPVAACSRCRTAKIKCDGKLPACSACERAGKTGSCSGATNEFAKGKERSYVAALEAQCDRLQKRIEVARNNNQQQQAAFSTGSPSMFGSPAVPGNGRATHRKEASDIDDLVGDFGFLSVNATSRDFYGITSSTSFAGLLLTVATAEPLPLDCYAREFPPHPQTVRLVQYYFDNIYMLLPFFLETKFWASVDAIYQDGGRFATQFDRWSVRMVLAIASAMISQSSGDNNCEIAIAHACAALKCAGDVLHPGSLAGIQAILLLAQYSMLAPRYFRTWYLIGMAARVATDLGIHQEQSSSETYVERSILDQRRRTFHCLYSLDRYVSTAFGRAFSFSDDSVNVPLPSDSPLPAMGAAFLKSIEPALSLFQIRHHQSNCYQEIFCSGQHPSDFQPFTWEKCTLAMDWFETARKHIPSPFIPIYRLELLYTLILVLSPSRRTPMISQSNQVLLFNYTIDFITTLYQVIDSYSSSPSCLVITYIDIERASVATNSLIDVIHHYHTEVLSDSVPGPQSSPPTLPSSSSSSSQSPPPPPYKNPDTRHDRITRALGSLRNASSIFKYAWKRWNIRILFDDFQRRSTSIEAILSECNDQQHEPRPRPQPQPPSLQQQQEYPHHRHLQSTAWTLSHSQPESHLGSRLDNSQKPQGI